MRHPSAEAPPSPSPQHAASSIQPSASRRLLVFFARVGDLVMLTPLMRQLARDGGVDLLARPWARGLLDGQPWLGAIHTLAKPNLTPLWDALSGARRGRLGAVLGARGYDEIVVMDRESPRLRSWIDGWRGAAAVRAIPIGQVPAGHAVDMNRAAALRAGVPADGFPEVPRLDVPAARLAAARIRLAPLGARVLAVQAGSSLTHRWIRKQPNLKGLAPEQWARLMARIIADGDADAAVLHGSAPEGREAAAIRAALPGAVRDRVHDWTGRVPLADLPAVLQASHATLSVDTGPAHIAAAVGSPLLAVFGPTDPARFLPRGPGPIELLLGRAACQYCHETPLFRTCRRNICLRDLGGDAIHGAWARLRGPMR